MMLLRAETPSFCFAKVLTSMTHEGFFSCFSVSGPDMLFGAVPT